MGKRDQRRIFHNIGWQAERYFSWFQFVLLMLTMVYLLYLIFGTVDSVSGQMGGTSQAELAAICDRINFMLLIRITILFIAVFIINLTLGLFFMHRLTGPLVRIRGVLTAIAVGNVPPADVVLRKGDFPVEIAEALSEALRRIRRLEGLYK